LLAVVINNNNIIVCFVSFGKRVTGAIAEPRFVVRVFFFAPANEFIAVDLFATGAVALGFVKQPGRRGYAPSPRGNIIVIIAASARFRASSYAVHAVLCSDNVSRR